jgi:hypothetical protein
MGSHILSVNPCRTCPAFTYEHFFRGAEYLWWCRTSTLKLMSIRGPILYLLLCATCLDCTHAHRYVFTFYDSNPRRHWNEGNWSASCGDCTSTYVKSYGRRLVLDLQWGSVDVRSTAFRLFHSSMLETVEEDASIAALSLDFVQGQDLQNPTDNHTIEFNTMMAQSSTTNSTQAALNYTSQSIESYSLGFVRQWNLAQIAVQETWDKYGRGKQQTVALLDTGIAASVVDMGMFETVLDGFDFVSDPNISMDGDGRDSNVFDPGDASPPTCSQSSWHGTYMASILASKNLGQFMGIAEDAALLPIRVLGRCKTGYASDVTDAIVWAVGGNIMGVERNQHPSGVLVMALVGMGPCPSFMQSAVDLATAKGILIYAAAGNDGLDASVHFPANCRGVVSVAASDIRGNITRYSATGADLLLPGGDEQDAVPCVSPDAQVGKCVGTSIAVVHAGGIAACEGKDGNFFSVQAVPYGSTSVDVAGWWHNANSAGAYMVQAAEGCSPGSVGTPYDGSKPMGFDDLVVHIREDVEGPCMTGEGACAATPPLVGYECPHEQPGAAGVCNTGASTANFTLVMENSQSRYANDAELLTYGIPSTGRGGARVRFCLSCLFLPTFRTWIRLAAPVDEWTMSVMWSQYLDPSSSGWTTNFDWTTLMKGPGKTPNADTVQDCANWEVYSVGRGRDLVTGPLVIRQECGSGIGVQQTFGPDMDFNMGSWHVTTLTYGPAPADSSHRELKVYVNGTLYMSQTLTNPRQFVRYDVSPQLNDRVTLYGLEQRSHRQKVDFGRDVRFYTSRLSAAAVASLSNDAFGCEATSPYCPGYTYPTTYVCNACLAGTFSNASTPSCTPCSNGTYSAEGADTCTPCTVCESHEYEATSCSSTTNRECASCTLGSVRDDHNPKPEGFDDLVVHLREDVPAPCYSGVGTCAATPPLEGYECHGFIDLRQYDHVCNTGALSRLTGVRLIQLTIHNVWVSDTDLPTYGVQPTGRGGAAIKKDGRCAEPGVYNVQLYVGILIEEWTMSVVYAPYFQTSTSECQGGGGYGDNFLRANGDFTDIFFLPAHTPGTASNQRCVSTRVVAQSRETNRFTQNPTDIASGPIGIQRICYSDQSRTAWASTMTWGPSIDVHAYQWHVITLTYGVSPANSENRALNVYVNGTLYMTETLTDPEEFLYFTADDPETKTNSYTQRNSVNKFIISALKQPREARRMDFGRDLRFYKRQLSAADAASLSHDAFGCDATSPHCPGYTYPASPCAVCSAGTFSGVNQSACTPCSSGEYAVKGAVTCNVCAVCESHEYTPVPCAVTTNRECTLCPDGNSCDGTSAEECPANYKCVGGIKSACEGGTISAPGSHECFVPSSSSSSSSSSRSSSSSSSSSSALISSSSSSSSSYVGCPAGFYCPTLNPHDKIACPAGTFSDDHARVCQLCPHRHYSSQAASRSCTPCPVGTNTIARGSEDPTDCRSCPAFTPRSP